jgi:hypothetical protein
MQSHQNFSCLLPLNKHIALTKGSRRANTAPSSYGLNFRRRLGAVFAALASPLGVKMTHNENDEIIKQLTLVAKRTMPDAEVVCGANPGEPLRIRVKFMRDSKSPGNSQTIIIKLHEDIFSSEFFQRHRSELDVVFAGFIRKKLAQFKPQEGEKAQQWETVQYWIFPPEC